jgi:hypothetical protein
VNELEGLGYSVREVQEGEAQAVLEALWKDGGAEDQARAVDFPDILTPVSTEEKPLPLPLTPPPVKLSVPVRRAEPVTVVQAPAQGVAPGAKVRGPEIGGLDAVTSTVRAPCKFTRLLTF